MATSGAQGLARGLSRGLELGLARKAAKRQETLFEQGQTDRETKIEQEKKDREDKELDREIASLYNIMNVSKNMDDTARAQFWNARIKPLEEKKTGKPLPDMESISSKMAKLDLKIAAIEGSNDDPAAKKASIKSLIANAERDPSLASEVKRRRDLAWDAQKMAIAEAGKIGLSPPRWNSRLKEPWDDAKANDEDRQRVSNDYVESMRVLKTAGLKAQNPYIDPGRKAEIDKILADQIGSIKKQREGIEDIVPGKSSSLPTGDVKNYMLAQKNDEIKKALELSEAAKLKRSQMSGVGEKIDQASMLTNLVDQIQPYVDQIFTAKGLKGRAFEGIRNIIQGATQQGSQGANLAVYESMVNGVLGVFGRIMSGEKGNLTNADIARVKGMFPNPYTLFGPDTQDVAEQKMKVFYKNLEELRREVLARDGIKPVGTLEEKMKKLPAQTQSGHSGLSAEARRARIEELKRKRGK